MHRAAAHVSYVGNFKRFLDRLFMRYPAAIVIVALHIILFP